MKALAVGVVALWLPGCSFLMTKTETFWEKPGATAQDFNMDRGQCNAQAFSVAGGNFLQIALVQNSCMQGKGWYQVERQVPRF